MTYTWYKILKNGNYKIEFDYSLQDATNRKFHDGIGVPINVLEGANGGNDVWLGFSDGDIAIMTIEKRNVGTRWKAHPGGVSCIVAMTNSVWSGDFHVLSSCSPQNMQVIR